MMNHKGYGITSVKGFQKEFEKMEPHLRAADNRDVKDALKIAEMRRTNDMPTWSKKNNFQIGCSMPSAWWYNPVMSRIDTTGFTAKEWKNYWRAFTNVYGKLKYHNQ